MLRKNYVALLFFLIGCFFNLPAFSEPELKFSSKPPPGFEDLTALQTTSVDVYFGDNKIVEVMASFSATEFQFTQPQLVVNQIPRLKPTEKNTVLKALTGNLNQHSDLVCQKPNFPVNCGRLKPDIAGIIFNANTFKLQLFVNPTLLEIIHLTDNPYIPYPETQEFSFLQNLSGGFAGNNTKLNYNLRSTSLFGYDLTRLRLITQLTEKQFSLNTAALETEWRDVEALAGMFRTQGFSLLGQQEILGLHAATSFKQRTDLRSAYGNELVVFLPQRALVRVFRDKQLLFSQKLEAGNQTIDSSYFPDGVYNLEIEIEEDSGNKRSQNYFFAKSLQLPPLNNPFYLAEIGIRKKMQLNSGFLPDYTTIPLVHLAHAKRVNDIFGYDTELLYSGKEFFGNFGLFYMYHHFNLRLAGLISNVSYAAELRANLQFDQFNASVNLNKYWRYHNKPLLEDSLSLQPFTQADLNLNYSFENGTNWNVRGQWRENEISGVKSHHYSILSTVFMPLFQMGGFRADVGLSYSKLSGDQLAMFSLRLQQSTPAGINLSSQSQVQYQPAASRKFDFNTSLNANWQHTQQNFTDKRLTLDVRKQSNSQAARLSGDYLTSVFGFNGYAEHTLPNHGQGVTSYGGQLTTNIIGDKEGLSLGGMNIGESVIVIDLRGTPKGAGFDVLASRLAKFPSAETKIADAYVGAKNVIALPTYETYQIRLVPHKETFVHYENKSYVTTLYPATISRLVWNVKQTFALISVIVRPDGSLVTDAKVEGAIEPALTDEQGLLQADVDSESKLLFKVKNIVDCQVELPENLQPKNGLVMLDKLICQPVTLK